MRLLQQTLQEHHPAAWMFGRYLGTQARPSAIGLHAPLQQSGSAVQVAPLGLRPTSHQKWRGVGCSVSDQEANYRTVRALLSKLTVACNRRYRRNYLRPHLTRFTYRLDVQTISGGSADALQQRPMPHSGPHLGQSEHADASLRDCAHAPIPRPRIRLPGEPRCSKYFSKCCGTVPDSARPRPDAATHARVRRPQIIHPPYIGCAIGRDGRRER